MTRAMMDVRMDETELDFLRALQRQYPTIDAAVARQAELRAAMSLPKGMVHIFSDVHGEIKKLRHIINNASGQLRPVVASLRGGSLSAQTQRDLLNLIYYPHETLSHVAEKLAIPEEKTRIFRTTVGLQLELLRVLAKRYPMERLREVLPREYANVLLELIFAEALGREESFVSSIYDSLLSSGKGIELIRKLSRSIRNIAVDELIVAGDMGDRGPRIDKVIEYLMRQPRVAITWGNHDVCWMGACLGHEALIATVLRISLRYHRLSQLEEGYGISLAPLAELAESVYKDDPAKRFKPKEVELADPAPFARMQKAISIIQFKLEGQLSKRHPEYNMADRDLLHLIDYEKGTITLDGNTHELLDKHFPTIDPQNPYELTEAEAKCMATLKKSFLESRVLWTQMSYLFQQGDMFVIRDNHVIFHGCVPVDAEGNFLTMPIRGHEYKGRALFDAMESELQRAWRHNDEMSKDMLWYLWTGPISPIFGKDKMATFERYFVADKTTHKENKNPYFKLIHQKDFCTRIFAEFGVSAEHGLLVNGHVPVKIEEGESPVKKSGSAVTIDGAFSEAYGDKGYTLVMEAEHTSVAAHHHFESIEEAITKGADIIPQLSEIKAFDPIRRVGDTPRGERMRRECDSLSRLIVAYEENILGEGHRSRLEIG